MSFMDKINDAVESVKETAENAFEGAKEQVQGLLDKTDLDEKAAAAYEDVKAKAEGVLNDAAEGMQETAADAEAEVKDATSGE